MKITHQLFAFSLLAATTAGFGASNTIRETTGGPDTAPLVLNVAAGLLTSGASASPGMVVGINSRITHRGPIYLGGEFGAYVVTRSPAYAMFPLLASGYVQFELSSGVHPLLGAMIGPVFSTSGGSSAQLEILFRPGLNFELGRNFVLNMEPRFGVMGSSFIFVPQLGVILAI